MQGWERTTVQRWPLWSLTSSHPSRRTELSQEYAARHALSGFESNIIAVHSPRHIWSNSPRRDGLSYSWQLLAASADNDFQLLVLGRPGSGTTSLLKVLSNTREEFRDVSGDVFYGNAGAKEARQFRHQIVMNTEEDLHFPTLKSISPGHSPSFSGSSGPSTSSSTTLPSPYSPS